MTARLRGLFVVAILLALAAHPLAHPWLQECPCVHQIAHTVERNDALVLPLVAERAEARADVPAEPPVVGVRASRAPPVV